MTTYPISVEPLQAYYGDDPRKQRTFEKDRQRAENIAFYINRKMERDYKDRESWAFTFGEIAISLGLEEKTVQRYLHRMSSSSDNSILIHRPPSGNA